MYKTNSESYRNDILTYFRSKNPDVYETLKGNFSDWRYPFKTAHRLSDESDENIDVSSFLAGASIFNKYKGSIRTKASYKVPERGDMFLKKILTNRSVYQTITAFTTSVFIASRMMDDLIKNSDVNWFLKSKTEIDGKQVDSEFIVVDTPNVWYTVSEYTGENPSIIRFRDSIIRGRKLHACLDDMITYMSEDLNGNIYKYIFIVPGKFSKIYDFAMVIPVDCTNYIGGKCSKDSFSNEVDDSLLLMMYDWIKYKYNVNVSVLSGDNFDYSSITQDYSTPIERAMFSDDSHSLITNWQDILYDYGGLTFDKDTPLTIFEENLKL